MFRMTHKTRRMLQAFALVASAAAIAIPAATAGNESGMVARQLGSQDSRDTAGEALYLPGMVASTLGSQDSRDTAGEIPLTPSVVAGRLGTPDARDAVQRFQEESLLGDYMFRDYFRDPAGQAATPQAPSATVSDGGIDWRTVGIGIGAALGGALLLVALVVGVVEVRHTKHRLGSA